MNKMMKRWFSRVLSIPSLNDMSHNMTKPTMWLWAQWRLRSAWASAQSDQHLRCPHKESLGPELPIKCTAKTLIRLGGCPGWAESSLGAHSFCWFCHVAAHIDMCTVFYEGRSTLAHVLILKVLLLWQTGIDLTFISICIYTAVFYW